MYFYIDESGQTGLNLFDETQPHLYYGVLSSKTNIDILAQKTVKNLRKRLNVERLHGAELGNGKLIEIVDDVIKLRKKFNLKFDLYKVVKADHALICFFDQVFDQGMNPAVPWTAYWTPLRYILLIKLAYLFDDELLKKAWSARITISNQKAEECLIQVCKEIMKRVDMLPDIRSCEIITDVLSWAIKFPSEIHYNVNLKKDSLQISPNLIGFQLVMHGIAKRLKGLNKKATKIIVDRQSQFNNAQDFISKFYNQHRGITLPSGPGLPVIDLKNIPNVPISCISGTESIGLELVDVFIWIFKRLLEGKNLAPQLNTIIKDQMYRARYDEVSINALTDRWGDWFNNLPEPSEDQKAKAKEMIEFDEARRKRCLSTY